MTMVCGLDLHRRQITFDALEVSRAGVGRPAVAAGPGAVPALAGDDVTARGWWPGVDRRGGLHCWRHVVEEVVAAGFEAHLAEPADTQAARGRKRRAKTDRSDCRLLRGALAERSTAGHLTGPDSAFRTHGSETLERFTRSTPVVDGPRDTERRARTSHRIAERGSSSPRQNGMVVAPRCCP